MIAYFVRKFHLTDRFSRKLKTKFYYTQRSYRTCHRCCVYPYSISARCIYRSRRNNVDIVVLLTEHYWRVSGRARSFRVFEPRFTSVQRSFAVCVAAAFRNELEAIFPTFSCTSVYTLFTMKWRSAWIFLGFTKDAGRPNPTCDDKTSVWRGKYCCVRRSVKWFFFF